MDLSTSVGCDFAVTVVTVVAAGGSELTARVGRLAVTVRLVDAPASAPVVLPGARLGIAGRVVGTSDGGHVVVTVQAADVHVV